MSTLNLLAVGLVGPGLPDWETARRILTGQQPHRAATIPPLSPAALPANERRRATLATRIALEAGAQAVAAAGLDARELVTVWAAAESDLTIIDRLCTDIFALHTPVSPTVFHNSVHNAVAGYWSIAHGCRQPSTSLSAWDGSLAAGLLECAVQLAGADPPILLVAYDLPGPQLIAAHRHLEGPFACAMVLSSGTRTTRLTADPLASLEVELAAHAAEDRLPSDLDPALETLRSGNPAARCLPLLHRIAVGGAGSVRLPYLDDLDLMVRVA